jgi:hypothetical protein
VTTATGTAGSAKDNSVPELAQGTLDFGATSPALYRWPDASQR